MIAIATPGPVEERFLREILAPLGRPIESIETRTPESLPDLRVLWLGAGPMTDINRLAAHAEQTLVIAPAGMTIPFVPGAMFHPGFRPGAVTNKARTLLARAAANILPDLLQFGPYDFHPRENTVHDKNTNQNQKLTDKERDMLLILLQAGGKAISRQALMDSVWAYAPDVETHTLETHIYRLRQKIEKDPANPALLLTDADGYRILAS